MAVMERLEAVLRGCRSGADERAAIYIYISRYINPLGGKGGGESLTLLSLKKRKRTCKIKRFKIF